jgi:hypothetical protein
MGCLRILLAIPAGLIVMGLTVWLLELLSHAIFPASPEMQAAIQQYVRDPASPAAIDAIELAIPTMPPASYIMLAAGWTIGTLCGSYAAARIAAPRWSWPAWLVGIVSIAAIATNVNAIPHPEWMQSPAIYFLPIGACICGALLAKSHAAVRAASRATANAETSGSDVRRTG